MALIDITPVMTSNTTPSPYVVSASSSLDSNYLPFLAFDGKELTYYHSKSGMSQWIKIDFGMVTDMSAISLKSSPSSTNYTGIPKHFILYGSNDDLIYEKIHQEENEINWISGETRLYKLSQEVSFRYYKLSVVSTMAYNYVAICQIGFYQDDGITPTENSKTVSRRYTLPFGSKLRLDNLTSDLTYMLATEDDGENEGTLRIVNHAGKFILPKAGIKKELIWSGSVTEVNSSMALSKNASNFRLLLVYGEAFGNFISILIPELKMTSLRMSSDGNAFTNYALKLSDDGANIVITSRLNNSWIAPITKVYGIY